MCKNYYFILLLLLNIFCNLINARFLMADVADDHCTTKVEINSSALQLKRHLLCYYDTNVRPVQSNKNVTTVKLAVWPRFINYNHLHQIFTLDTVTKISWKDMHLTWDTKEFDDLHVFYTPIDEIWSPDIAMHNEYEIGNKFSIQSNVLVTNNGTVIWVRPVRYSMYCIDDITWWPYDILKCSLQFGSWSYSNDEIKLEYAVNAIDWTGYGNDENPEWYFLATFMTIRTEKNKYNLNSTADILSYHFIFRRNWSYVRLAFVTSTIVLMVMTLIALWLEPKSTERMIIANLNFVCHLLCMHDEKIPKNCFNNSKLLIFYEGSFVMALFTLVLTSILRHLQELNTEPPVWISTITTTILHSRVGRILYISILDPATTTQIEIDADGNTNLMQVNSKRSSWTYVTVLIGWLALVSVSLAYIILLSINFPTYTSVDFAAIESELQ